VTSSFSKTKVSFVFRSTKDLRKMPLENWVFCMLFLEDEVQVGGGICAMMLFMSGQVGLPGIGLILREIKMGSKC